MIKILAVIALIIIMLILAVGLRDLFSGNSSRLGETFAWRIGLSILLLVLIIVAYLADMITVSEYAQYI